jgi:hypothetical protein
MYFSPYSNDNREKLTEHIGEQFDLAVRSEVEKVITAVRKPDVEKLQIALTALDLIVRDTSIGEPGRIIAADARRRIKEVKEVPAP